MLPTSLAQPVFPFALRLCHVLGAGPRGRSSQAAQPPFPAATSECEASPLNHK